MLAAVCSWEKKRGEQYISCSAKQRENSRDLTFSSAMEGKEDEARRMHHGKILSRGFSEFVRPRDYN